MRINNQLKSLQILNLKIIMIIDINILPNPYM